MRPGTRREHQVADEAAGEVELGASFEHAIPMHRIVMEVDMAHNLHRDYVTGADQLSLQLRELLERGRSHPAIDYVRAVAAREALNANLDGIFDEYDAILTPAAPGPAPRGLGTTGNPVFCTIWTYLGTPAVTLPLMQSEDGLPLGVQLIARRGNDARLLRTASWLAKTCIGDARGRGRKRVVAARRASKRKSSP